MSGGITMSTADSAFNDKGIIFGDVGRIGGSTSLGIYSANSILLRPNSQTSASSYGLRISYDAITYNDNTIWHAGNDGSGSGLDSGLHLCGSRFYGKSDKPYHLVAEYVSASANTQLNFGITLLVRKFYPSDSNYSGILIIRCRYEASSTSPAFCSASWVVNNGLSTSDFIVSHKRVSGIVTVRLYAKRTGWGSYCFSKLDEGGWSTNEDDWSLYYASYSSAYAMASIPSDETQVTSQLVDISNRAASAVKLSTSRTINGSSFNGTANITIAPSLLISGDTIASQVGNQTSSYITVPYASNADTLDGQHLSYILNVNGSNNN